MNWDIRFWRLKKWILLHLTERSYLDLPPNYITQFLASLGDQSEMRIGGKPLTIHITGMGIFGVGKLEWAARSTHLHHVFICCQEKGMNQFELNCMTGNNVPHSIISGNLPPWIMAEKVKELLDK